MKILELLSSPVWTGPAEPVASVARELLRKGHRVELAVDSRRPGDLREQLHRLGLQQREDLALSTKSGPFRITADVRQLRQLSRDFDVFHANFSHDHVLCVLATSGQPGSARIVRTVHSERSLRRRSIQGWIYQRTDGLIAVCEAYARLLRERFRLPAQRVTAVRGAVNAELFTPEGADLRQELGIAPQAPVAGIVARIKPERHHLDLLRAFQPLAKSLPDARLLIVGRGEGLESLQGEVARMGFAQSVIFGGYRMGGELIAAYRTMDVKVLLAEGNDGTCRALLEAMACGRAALAYRFGAPAETIVDGVTGLLVERGDVAALSQALARLLKSRSYCRELGAAGRAAILDRYTERQRGDAVENFLAGVLKLPRASARFRARPSDNPA